MRMLSDDSEARIPMREGGRQLARIDARDMVGQRRFQRPTSCVCLHQRPREVKGSMSPRSMVGPTAGRFRRLGRRAPLLMEVRRTGVLHDQSQAPEAVRPRAWRRPTSATPPRAATSSREPGLRREPRRERPSFRQLRALFVSSGFVAPHANEPPIEALVFGLAGGIGAGVFAFLYEAEDVATFFIGGRHLWHDDVAWCEGATLRLNVTPEIRESGGRKQARAHLREALSLGRPVVAWVDKALLPHRGLPAWLAGSGYD